MANKPDPRSPEKKRKDAAYAALPPLRIHRPLRAIANAFGPNGSPTKAAKSLHKLGGNGLQRFALALGL